MSVIMTGCGRNKHGEIVKYGLALLEDYVVDHVVVRWSKWVSPQDRVRIYFVGIRRDVGGAQQLGACENLLGVVQDSFPKGHVVRLFAGPSDGCQPCPHGAGQT